MALSVRCFSRRSAKLACNAAMLSLYLAACIGTHVGTCSSRVLPSYNSTLNPTGTASRVDARGAAQHPHKTIQYASTTVTDTNCTDLAPARTCM